MPHFMIVLIIYVNLLNLFLDKKNVYFGSVVVRGKAKYK